MPARLSCFLLEIWRDRQRCYNPPLATDPLCSLKTSFTLVSGANLFYSNKKLNSFYFAAHYNMTGTVSLPKVQEDYVFPNLLWLVITKLDLKKALFSQKPPS